MIIIFGMAFPLDSLIFQMVKPPFILSGIFYLFFLSYTVIFNRFIENLGGEISSFLTGMEFPHLVCKEMIYPLPSGKNYDLVPQSIFFPLWQYHFFTQKDVEMPHL